ncbi:MAG: hypothetical protein ABL893_07435, partial [Hyphomicrobium sp.]
VQFTQFPARLDFKFLDGQTAIIRKLTPYEVKLLMFRNWAIGGIDWAEPIQDGFRAIARVGGIEVDAANGMRRAF